MADFCSPGIMVSRAEDGNWMAHVRFWPSAGSDPDRVVGEIFCAQAGPLAHVVDVVRFDAQRLGVALGRGLGEGPMVYVEGDGELNGLQGAEVRAEANAQSRRLGWRCAYDEVAGRGAAMTASMEDMGGDDEHQPLGRGRMAAMSDDTGSAAIAGTGDETALFRYGLVSPGDAYTFEAPNDDVATAVVALLGTLFGWSRDGRTEMPGLHDLESEAGRQIVASCQRILEHPAEVVAALRSMEIDAEERRRLGVDPEAWHNERRTSAYDVRALALETALRLEGART